MPGFCCTTSKNHYKLFQFYYRKRIEWFAFFIECGSHCKSDTHTHTQAHSERWEPVSDCCELLGVERLMYGMTWHWDWSFELPHSDSHSITRSIPLFRLSRYRFHPLSLYWVSVTNRNRIKMMFFFRSILRDIFECEREHGTVEIACTYSFQFIANFVNYGSFSLFSLYHMNVRSSLHSLKLIRKRIFRTKKQQRAFVWWQPNGADLNQQWEKNVCFEIKYMILFIIRERDIRSWIRSHSVLVCVSLSAFASSLERRRTLSLISCSKRRIISPCLFRIKSAWWEKQLYLFHSQVAFESQFLVWNFQLCFPICTQHINTELAPSRSKMSK